MTSLASGNQVKSPFSSNRVRSRSGNDAGSISSNYSLNAAEESEVGDMVGDLPTENTPLLYGSISSVTSKTDPNTRKRSQSRIGSFLGSVSAAISSSVRQLEKSVGFLQGFMLIVGILIGSGIFISPSLVLHSVNDVGVSFVIWVGCGLIALGGALCYCELGCAIKKAGGNYAYINEAYGSLPGFLCAWTVAFIVDPAGVAAITLTFGTYLMKPFAEWTGDNQWYPKILAAVCILIIAFINCWSVTMATRAQTLFTVCQMVAVLFVVILGVWQLSLGHTSSFENMFNMTAYLGNRSSFGMQDIGPLGAALYNGLWSYDGWALVSNVSEEMKDLNRDLFLSIITGIPFVIMCYLLINVAFLAALTPKQVGDSPAIAITFVEKILGKKVAYIMPPLVALSCYGAANGTIFACGRLSLAAGREGHLPEVLAMIHRTRHTPIPAVVLTAIISLAMLLPDASGLETLISFFNTSCWFIYGLSIFAVVVLRVKQPDIHRPYKVWLITPILMTLISIVLVIIPFFDEQWYNPLIAIGMIALGIPVWFLFVYLEPKHPQGFKNVRTRVTKGIQKSLNLAPCRY